MSKKNQILGGLFLGTIILMVGLLVWSWKQGKLRFFAQGENEITNTATSTFTDSQGNSGSVTSNQVIVQKIVDSNIADIQILLQGRTNFSETGVFKIFPAGNPTSVFEKNDLVFDDSGPSQITLPELTAASYDVELKLAYYLKVKLLNVAKADLNNLDFGTLRGGDFNNDNTVNTGDFNYMVNRWGGSDPVADINQDNEVNNADFTVINANWTMQGN